MTAVIHAASQMAGTVWAGSFNEGGAPPVPPSACAVSGTLLTADQDDIVSGGRTIVLTLDSDGWEATLGEDNAITQKNINTGADEAATELLGLTARVSLTKRGDAIHGDLTVSTTERSAKPGTYYGFFDGDKLRTHLPDYVGTKVYVVLQDGSHILVGDECIVLEIRRSSEA